MNTVGCHKSYTQSTIQKQMVSTWLYTQIKEFANTELLQQEQLTEHKLKIRMCTVKMTTQTHVNKYSNRLRYDVALGKWFLMF
jgi:hypothetical protein